MSGWLTNRQVGREVTSLNYSPRTDRSSYTPPQLQSYYSGSTNDRHYNDYYYSTSESSRGTANFGKSSKSRFTTRGDNIHTESDNIHTESDNIHTESDNIHTESDNIRSHRDSLSRRTHHHKGGAHNKHHSTRSVRSSFITEPYTTGDLKAMVAVLEGHVARREASSRNKYHSGSPFTTSSRRHVGRSGDSSSSCDSKYRHYYRVVPTLPTVDEVVLNEEDLHSTVPLEDRKYHRRDAYRRQGGQGAAPYREGGQGAAPYREGGQGAAPYREGGQGAAPYREGGQGAAPYREGGQGAAPYREGGQGATPYSEGGQILHGGDVNDLVNNILTDQGTLRGVMPLLSNLRFESYSRSNKVIAQSDCATREYWFKVLCCVA